LTAAEPWQASVRLTVDDPTGSSSATGTIIANDDGTSLVATCWHLIRESGRDAPVRAALVHPVPAQWHDGQVVYTHETRDVALVYFSNVGDGYAVAKIATEPPTVNVDRLTTVGCETGVPIAWNTYATKVGGLTIPAIVVAGNAVEGRSGGGLFNAAGDLLGTCTGNYDAGTLYTAPTALRRAVDVHEANRRPVDPVDVAAPVDVVPMQQYCPPGQTCPTPRYYTAPRSYAPTRPMVPVTRPPIVRPPMPKPQPKPGQAVAPSPTVNRQPAPVSCACAAGDKCSCSLGPLSARIATLEAELFALREQPDTFKLWYTPDQFAIVKLGGEVKLPPLTVRITDEGQLIDAGERDFYLGDTLPLERFEKASAR
jgi:hypothetical protein